MGFKKSIASLLISRSPVALVLATGLLFEKFFYIYSNPKILSLRPQRLSGEPSLRRTARDLQFGLLTGSNININAYTQTL